jgi:TRAP-type C4-dicarboxylate transport system permease small subunit
MTTAYRRLMDACYIACIWIAAISMIIMTLIIPYGVFTRYVLNSASAWPEPMSVLLMIVFSFFGGAACYRAQSHIAVTGIVDLLPATGRKAMRWFVDFCMAAISVFMVIWGMKLADRVWGQVIGEFPFLSVGITYLPIPIGGLLTLLFIIEKVWIGPPPPGSFVYREPISTE